MNQDHERMYLFNEEDIRRAQRDEPKPVSVGKTGEDAPLRREGVKMPKGEIRRDAATGTKLEERRPGKISGWRPQRQLDKAFSVSKAREDLARKSGDLLGHSVWRRRNVLAISTLVMAAAPDGSGDVIAQWHVSFSNTEVEGKRCTDEEIKQSLACFGLVGAEEDNHEPGVARHFWMPLDPKRRVDCECKDTEKTITEPDGHRWSTPKDDRECHGCNHEVAILEETGVHRPCPIHGTTVAASLDKIKETVERAARPVRTPSGKVASVVEFSRAMGVHGQTSEQIDAAERAREHDEMMNAKPRPIGITPIDPKDQQYARPRDGWGPSALAAIVPVVRELEALKDRIAGATSTPRAALNEKSEPGSIAIELVGDPMTGTCSRCGVDLDELAKQGETGHVCGLAPCSKCDDTGVTLAGDPEDYVEVYCECARGQARKAREQ